MILIMRIGHSNFLREIKASKQEGAPRNPRIISLFH
ncbi:hypothetical protein GGQ79_001055 [Ochrobactrum pecoris]|uniref:Uncharacterized protein n=1 Tax=Brucella pecoris TaxID=867683 RepID=A0AB34YP28_9HYPH|nr:hypothetical protein [Brucella pecoris]